MKYMNLINFRKRKKKQGKKKIFFFFFKGPEKIPFSIPKGQMNHRGALLIMVAKLSCILAMLAFLSLEVSLSPNDS